MLNVQQSLKKEREAASLYKQSLAKQRWNPLSWRNFSAKQQPVYADQKLLDHCLDVLKKAPALVHYSQIEQLKKHIARAGKGQEFLLQAGDCAEQFQECHPEIVKNKINSILQIKETIEQNLNKPVTVIGRIAGQYAKPRSSETETIHSTTLPSFRGDIIHSREFSFEARKTNPTFMLRAYEKSAETFNYMQNLRGFASLPFFASHEALLLCYESALTRPAENNYFYNMSTHFLWLGERTRDLQGAHVEYLRGIENPIGIKLSHKVTNDELINLILTLNPNKEAGKILLIHRIGHDYVDLHLPRLIRAVKRAGLTVTWMCDPMHGNSEILANGIKTRDFENISSELFRSVEIHRAQGTILAGVHLETAAENVTECLGGKQKIQLCDLEKNYKSACDPRLNSAQSLELSAEFAKRMILQR
ncbi:MAG: 3-deoxy-7-phosphoheptulonate synthase [Bdellovibrionota bacterium]